MRRGGEDKTALSKETLMTELLASYLSTTPTQFDKGKKSLRIGFLFT